MISKDWRNMASIKLDSRVVVEACEKSLTSISGRHSELFDKLMGLSHEERDYEDKVEFSSNLSRMSLVKKIQKLAEYSPSLTIDINESDFELIGEHLPKMNEFKER